MALPGRDAGGKRTTSSGKPVRRRKHPYTLPKNFHTEAASRHDKPVAGPPKPKYTLPSGHRGDAPATRAKDMRKADRFKKTPKYVSAVKQAYKTRSVEDRNRRVAAILNKISGPRRLSGRDGSNLSIEDLSILDTHVKRAKRDKKLMQSQIFNDRQRKIVDAFKETPGYQKALLEAKFPVTDKRYKDLFESDPDKLKRMGFTAPGKLEKAISSPALGFSILAGAGESAAAVAEGAYHDPVGVPKKTLKSLPLAVAAIPVAAANTVLHPKKTGEAFVESITTPYDEKVKRVRKSGALEDIGNAAVLTPSVGGVSKLFMRGVRPRAAKLLSAGVERAPKTRGPVRYVVGSAIDEKKAARLEKLARKGKPLTALQNEALQKNRAAGRTVAVVPSASSFKIRRHGVAKPRGASIAGLRFSRAKGPLAKLAKQKYRLNTDEQKALWPAMEAGIHTPEAARQHLPTLIRKMEESRTADPRGHEKDMDVLAQLKEVAADPEKHFTPNLQNVLKDIEKYTDEISADEPQFKHLTKENRRRAVQAALLDLEPGEVPQKPHISAHEAAKGVATIPALKYAPESTEEFLARVDKAAAEQGLAKPMYFRHEKQRGGETDFGAAVVGGGKAKSTGGTYRGKTLDEGLFDTNFEQMLRGYEHNVKARHNYDLVIELNKRNRLKSLIPEDQGVTLGEALNRTNRHEPLMDKGSVVLVNLGLFEKHMQRAPGSDLDVPDAETALDAGLGDALSKAVVTDFNNVDPELLKTNGWQAWPKEALRELEAELHASSAGGRIFDIVKGTLSKAILLTGNLPWLAIQFASEAAITGIASKGRALTPHNLAGTVRWWKAMNDSQRTDVARAMGLGATGADTQVVKMGSSIHRGFGHTWRALKAADFWHKPRVAGQPLATLLSPVKWMRAADQGKTNTLRLLYAHSELTKRLPRDKVPVLADALDGMAENAKAVDRLLPVLEKPAPEQLAYLKAHPHVLDDVAETLDKALGDWTTLTASERTWANRFVMFYPYVRYSTRLVLYTMPVDHPAVSAILAELGEMQVEEYREIFGDDQLPWNIGMVMWGKDGNMHGIDLRRAHPGMNALFDIFTSGGDMSKLFSAAPPYLQWAIDQATSGSLFADRDWRVNGRAAAYGTKAKDFDAVTRLRILGDDVLSIMYPYRLAKDATQSGVQGDDSMLFLPDPIHFKPEGSIDELEAKFAKEHAANLEANEGLGSALLGPLYPQKTDAKQYAGQKEFIKKLRAQAKGGSKKTKSPFKTRGKTTPFKTRSSGSPFRSR